MAPRAKRKLEATEWASLEHAVTGLHVEWKLTASGIVHFKWDGSGKQTLTLASSEGADDAPRRVRARVEGDPAARAAAVSARAAAKVAAKQAAKAQSIDYYVDGVRYMSDTCVACGSVQEPLALLRTAPCADTSFAMSSVRGEESVRSTQETTKRVRTAKTVTMRQPEISAARVPAVSLAVLHFATTAIKSTACVLCWLVQASDSFIR